MFLGPKITFVCKFSKPCDKYYMIHKIYPNLPKFRPWWRHCTQIFENHQILRLPLFLGPKITFVCKFSKPSDKYYLIHKIYPNLPKFGPWWRHFIQIFENHLILRLPSFLGPKITFVCKFSKPCDKYYLIYNIYPNLPKLSMMTS